MRSLRLLAWAGVSVVVLAGCGSSNQNAGAGESAPSRVLYEDGQVARVVSVESVNTVTVDIDGEQRQVRLLNVVAPSENNNELSGSCLLQESTDFLREKLPEGAEVTLQFDDAQVGSSGYLDAALFVGDDMVNVDVVRAGMGATTYATEKDEFYPQISQAQQEAATEGVGLYDRAIDCTVPHRIQSAIDQVASAGEIGDEDERKAAYREASAAYNALSKEKRSPAQWLGSIVTLSAVEEQLDELKTALGDNYYDEKGMSAADHASASATATGRPGGN